MDSLKRFLAILINPRTNLSKLQGVENSGRPGLPDGNGGGAHSRFRITDILTNFPLVLGTLIVLGLFLLVLFGPLWAPKNPYISGQHIAPHYDYEKDEFVRPPLEPSDEFPLGTDRWGGDLLSMLMHGARNTLVACAYITMVRVLLGLFFGALAGWNEGATIDQGVMGLIGVVTSVPMLISSMLLIFALDIRRGLPVFIAALAAIGWTEIAQYIRSEFLVLRKAPYIEGARALGLSGFAIAIRHLLPNVLPQLLVITFLEMGAVMMLLGELGFVGVYIGGGSRISIEVDVFVQEIFHLPDVPEWGAMLAEGFRYLRAKPFVVLPPAMAFFIAVIGFNTLGEGLRRQIAISGINTAFLLRKRMILVFVGMTMATVYIINRTGPAPWFARIAQAFNGENAYTHVEALADMEGRGIAQPGSTRAAQYIATQFQAYGLGPAWKEQSYFYPVETRSVRTLSQPELTLLGQESSPQLVFKHMVDFGFVIDGHGGSGTAESQVVFVGFTEKRAPTREDYKGLDLRHKIVMVLESNAPSDFATEALIRGASGILWVVGESAEDVRSQSLLQNPGGDYLRSPTIPVFKIRSSVASSILAGDGLVLDDLFTQTGQTHTLDHGWFTSPLSSRVYMQLQLSAPASHEILNVVGYIPGSDYEYAEELIILFTSYDGLGKDPDGSIFPAINHSASGIGILLEIARLWHEQGLDTRRSVLFAAWGGGTFDFIGAEEYLGDRFNFRFLPTFDASQHVAPSVIFYLDNAGAGGESLLIPPSAPTQLKELFEDTAIEVGVPIETSLVGTSSVRTHFPSRVPWIRLQWSDAAVSPEMDVLDRVRVEKLQQLGEVFALAMTRVVRQTIY